MRSNDERSLSVLLVENDPVASHLFRRSLEENHSCLVDQASNLNEAMTKLKRNSYHLLLVESELDQENGVNLVDEVRRIHLNIPVVLMACEPNQDLRERVKNSIGVTLLIKNENHYQELSNILRESYRKFYRTGSKREKDWGRERSLERHLDSRMIPEIMDVRSGNRIQDELTGLYSHSYLHDRVVLEYARVTRYSYPLSCLMVDIDHFKSINEQYGHRVGDEILKKAGELLFENCRLSDIVARYGGEEFAVLLPHVDYQGAKELANRLRLVFAEHQFTVENHEINLTVSIGISSYPEDTIDHCAEITSYANDALFRAKALGRNCVTLYKDIVPTFGEGLPSLKISEDKILEFQRRMTEISSLARKAYIDASKALIRALENKDRFTAGHAASCAKYALQVAQVMGMSIEDAEIVQHAALLHDIGKICIPDNILLKSGKLSFAEFESMKQHPYLGYKILKPIKFLQQESILVLHHHEWFNGEGYPCRLKSAEIPLGSRIISVIDSYDTMRIAGGRYKKTFTVEDSVRELVVCAGAQFDPHVVKGFIEVLRQRGELTVENYDKEKLEQAILSCK